jgi:hypothetical protein
VFFYWFDVIRKETQKISHNFYCLKCNNIINDVFMSHIVPRYRSSGGDLSFFVILMRLRGAFADCWLSLNRQSNRGAVLSMLLQHSASLFLGGFGGGNHQTAHGAQKPDGRFIHILFV